MTLPDLQPGSDQLRVEEAKQERKQTWFGMGYESREEQSEEKQNVVSKPRTSVFSRSRPRSGAPGGGNRGGGRH